MDILEEEERALQQRAVLSALFGQACVVQIARPLLLITPPVVALSTPLAVLAVSHTISLAASGTHPTRALRPALARSAPTRPCTLPQRFIPNARDKHIHSFDSIRAVQ